MTRLGEDAPGIRLSVIIPAYQAAETIERAVLSALSWAPSDAEVIVVDDGSTDDTFAVVCALSELDRRLVVHRQENRGRSVARNTGFWKARGEWILFLDADDYLLSASFDSDVGNIDVAGVDLILFPYASDFGDGVVRFDEGTAAKFAEVKGVLRSDRLRSCMIAFDSKVEGIPKCYQINSACGRLYKRAAIEGMCRSFPELNGPFCEGLRFSEDRLFNLAFLTWVKSKIQFSSTLLYCWDIGLSGTCQVLKLSDVEGICAFAAKVRLFEELGIVSPVEADGLISTELLGQFRRFSRLTTELSDEGRTLWLDVLTRLSAARILYATPRSAFGPCGVFCLTGTLLKGNRVTAAYLYTSLVYAGREALRELLKRECCA